MAEVDPDMQGKFGKENVIRPLESVLASDIIEDSSLVRLRMRMCLNKMAKEEEKKALTRTKSEVLCTNSYNLYSGSDNKKAEDRRKLKISCAEALRMLAKRNVSNCRMLTETEGLLCLAKMVEKEKNELQSSFLFTIMEIATAAESNPDLRIAAFRTNLPAAKAVVEQLLRVIKEIDNPSLKIPAIKSIGLLARAFPASETRIIGSLVTQLCHQNLHAAAEATIALGKFACIENYVGVGHSRVIIELNVVPSLLKMLQGNGETK